MVSLKYHIYSLLAVFIALAVGTIIGIGIAGGPVGQTEAIKQQGKAIRDLRSRFKTYSIQLQAKESAIAGLQNDLKQADAVIAKTLPALLAGRLSGRSVCIVQVGPSAQRQVLTGSLKSAGALVSSVITIDPAYAFDQPAEMAKAAQLVPVEYQKAGTESYQQVWSFVAAIVASGGQGQPLAKLAATGILSAEGDFARPNSMVVLIAPNGDGAERLRELLIKPVLRYLGENNLTSAVVAPWDEKQAPEASLWDELDAPVVLHIDWAAGRICLIEALVKGHGSFGLGPDQEFLPRDLSKT